MGDTEGCSDSGSLREDMNHPCPPPCGQNPGEVTQDQRRQYREAKSWSRSWPGSQQKMANPRGSQRQEKAQGTAQPCDPCSPQCPCEV